MYGVVLFYVWKWRKLWSRIGGYLVVNVLFVYRIIISEFCRIGKWGNEVWMGGGKIGIKLGIVEFFGGFGGGFWGESGYLGNLEGFCLGMEIGDFVGEIGVWVFVGGFVCN